MRSKWTWCFVIFAMLAFVGAADARGGRGGGGRGGGRGGGHGGARGGASGVRRGGPSRSPGRSYAPVRRGPFVIARPSGHGLGWHAVITPPRSPYRGPYGYRGPRYGRGFYRQGFYQAAVGTAFVWIPGSWYWGERSYLWTPGLWSMPPEPSEVWIPAHWVWANGAWVWREGSWASAPDHETSDDPLRDDDRGDEDNDARDDEAAPSAAPPAPPPNKVEEIPKPPPPPALSAPANAIDALEPLP